MLRLPPPPPPLLLLLLLRLRLRLRRLPLLPLPLPLPLPLLLLLLRLLLLLLQLLSHKFSNDQNRVIGFILLKARGVTHSLGEYCLVDLSCVYLTIATASSNRLLPSACLACRSIFNHPLEKPTCMWLKSDEARAAQLPIPACRISAAPDDLH